MFVELHGNLLAQRYASTLTDLLHELERDEEALALFEELHTGFWDDLADVGYRCLELEQLPQALIIFVFLLRYFPNEVAYLAACADTLHGMKRFAEAALHYQELIERVPNIPDAHYYLAENYMLFKHPQHAIPLLEKVLELTEDSTHTLRDKTSQLLLYAKEALVPTTNSTLRNE